MLLRGGLLLAAFAVFLQIAVYMQPLLPKQYLLGPACETITRALLLKTSAHSEHIIHSDHTSHSHHTQSVEHVGHEHDANHHCQYCTVHANLVLPPELDIKEVFDRIQIRLIAFQKAFTHVWFVLQQLFLIPQGRAPPLFA